MRKHFVTLSVILLCTACTIGNAAHAGSYKFTTLEITGQYSSFATGVTQQNVVVGYREDDYGPHGFVWTKGNYTIVDVPGSTTTSLLAVNARGVAAGNYYSATTANDQVFTYDIATGTQTLLPINTDFFFFPGAIGRQGTVVGNALTDGHGPSRGFFDTRTKNRLLKHYLQAKGIDNAGDIVGTQAGINYNEGFIFDHGNYTILDAPGASSTSPSFITSNGVIGGFYSTGTDQYGFTLASGVYTTYAFPNAAATQAIGLTSGGELVGNYSIGSTSHGFVLVNGTYYPIDPPQSTNTTIASVNDKGTLVGNYVVGNRYFGFIAVCAADQRPCTQ